MSIGARIKQIRGKVSREEFSKRIGVHAQSLYRYETGNRAIDSNVIASVCKEFGISSEWLIFGEGSMRLGSPMTGPQDPEAPKAEAGNSASNQANGLLEKLENDLEHQRQLSESKDSEIAALRETIRAYKLALNAPNNRWGPFGNADTENGSQNTA
jgi:transcriptional regulator with XRE-family HTH domain